jgi:hypothetical protein
MQSAFTDERDNLVGCVGPSLGGTDPVDRQGFVREKREAKTFFASEGD